MSTALTTPLIPPAEPEEQQAFDALRPVEQRFTIIYVNNGGNAAAAYRETHPDRKGNKLTMQKLASKLANKPTVARAIHEVLRDRGYAPDAVRSKLMAYAVNNPADFELWFNGSKTLAQLAAAGVDTTTIQEVLVTIKPGPHGDQTTRKLRFCDPQLAVTTLGRMLGLLDERKHLSISGMIGVAALDLRDKSGEELDTIMAALTTGQPPPRLIDAVVVDSDTSK